MRCVDRGVYIGIFYLALGFLTLEFDAKQSDNIAVIRNSDANINNQITISCQSSHYPTSWNEPVSLTKLDFIRAGIYNDQFCRDYYDMSKSHIKRLLKLKYTLIVSELLKLSYLSDVKIKELWFLYKENCWNESKVKKCEQDLKNGLCERAKIYETQRLHQSNIFNDTDLHSSYHQARKQALQKTEQEKYKQHVKTHELDVQTIHFMQAYNIDHTEFQNLSGTFFQHQLFGEIASFYKKAAKIIFQHQIKESLIVPLVMDLGKCAFDATKNQLFPLAMQLNDFADYMAETSLSICKGAARSAADFIDVYVLNLKETVQHVAQLLTSVLRILGGAMCVMDNNPSHFQQRHSMQCAFDHDVHMFNAMCNVSKKAFAQWYGERAVQKKIEDSSKCITDLILHPYLIGKIGKVCWNLISKARELKALENLGILIEELGVSEFAEGIIQATKADQKVATTVGELEESMVSLFEGESEKILESFSKKLNKKDPLPTHNKNIMGHIFNPKKDGHVADNPQNRIFLRDLIQEKYYVKEDSFERHWYSRIDKDGKQWWAWTKNEQIRSGGLNETPLPWNDQTGYCKLTRTK